MYKIMLLRSGVWGWGGGGGRREMSAGLHSRNLLFQIKSYRIIVSVKLQWPSG